MVDRDRVLAKFDELEGYLGELRAVVPDRFEAYRGRLGDFEAFKGEVLAFLKK